MLCGSADAVVWPAGGADNTYTVWAPLRLALKDGGHGTIYRVYRMKLQLAVPTTWTRERLADGRCRYVMPAAPDDNRAGPGADLAVVVRESLPLPVDLAGWPLTALAAVATKG